MTLNKIVEPFILHDAMNTKKYFTMLRDEVRPIIIYQCLRQYLLKI